MSAGMPAEIISTIAPKIHPKVPSGISTECCQDVLSGSPPGNYSRSPAGIVLGINPQILTAVSLECREVFLQGFHLNLFQKYPQIFFQESRQKFSRGSVTTLAEILPKPTKVLRISLRLPLEIFHEDLFTICSDIFTRDASEQYSLDSRSFFSGIFQDFLNNLFRHILSRIILRFISRNISRNYFRNCYRWF